MIDVERKNKKKKKQQNAIFILKCLFLNADAAVAVVLVE